MTRREMLEQLANGESCNAPYIDCNAPCPMADYCRSPRAYTGGHGIDPDDFQAEAQRRFKEENETMGTNHSHNNQEPERDDDESSMAEFLARLRGMQSEISPARDATEDERSDLIPLNLRHGDKVTFDDHPYIAGGWPRVVTIHRDIFPAQDILRNEGGARMFRFDYTVILANDRPDGTVNLEEHPIDSRYFRKV
jgi:hypothetical protein